MKYLSVCSGIEAASVAWETLGWTPFAFAEIEPFPCAVLSHHYGSNLKGEPLSRNAPPNLGDMNAFKEWPNEPIDLLVGGTPCQSFSVAGLRKGLADPRGNLCLTYLAIADRYRPEWILWENVPGVLSSNGGRDFGAFIGGLGQLGYHASWRVLDAQYVRVDGFGRAVPQRRRRVFVVGHLGDWRRPAAVLFERESLQGHTAPRRQAGEGIAPTISSRPTGGGGLGTDFDCDGGLIATDEIARCVTAGYGLSADGFDASEDGTGRGTPLVPIAYSAMPMNSGKDFVVRETEVSQPLMAAGPGLGDQGGDYVAHPYTLAIRGRGEGHQLEYRQDGTANAVLTPNGGRAGIGVGAVAVGVTIHGTDKTARTASYTDVAGALRARMPGAQENSSTTAVQQGWAVRRLTPLECERLQGFPDGYTAVPFRGKPAADGPRYKALGNSMAVNVMRWLGRRIEFVTTQTDHER